MITAPDSRRHCYRCVYSWRSTSSVVRLCPRCKSRLWNLPRIRPPSPRRPGLGMREIVAPHAVEVRRLRRRYGVATLRVFGSVARGEAQPDSDVDLLVEYLRPSDILTRTRFRRELERIFHRKVDLVTEATLHWAARPYAVAEAVAI